MTISKRTRFLVLRRDNFTCRYCGRQAGERELHVDHVLPRARGGGDTLDNLVTACVDCNLGKGVVLLERTPGERRGLHDGEWFHTLHEDGSFNYQGQVLHDFEDGRLYVQLYDWILGESSDREIIGPLPADHLRFYADDRAMRLAYARATGSSATNWDWQERWIERMRAAG